MPCRYPWPARGSTVTCPGTSPRDHPFSGTAAVPRAGCRGAVAMPPPCKPFWSKNHAIRPCSDAFQGNPYSGNLPFFGKFRTNRQLAGIQESYSLHIVEGNGPGSSGAGWNGGGRVQNKPNMLYESRQTRLEQLTAKKYGTASAGLMRECGTHPEKTRKSPLAVARLQAGRSSKDSLQADSQTPSSPPPRRWRRGDSIVVSHRGVSVPPGLVHNSAPS